MPDVPEGVAEAHPKDREEAAKEDWQQGIGKDDEGVVEHSELSFATE